MHSEYNTLGTNRNPHEVRDKDALMKYENERASNYEINFLTGFTQKI